MIVYLLREFVCQVTWLARTNHSKCGGPKLLLQARDIYTGKFVSEGYPRDFVVPVPEHRIVEYTCLDVEDGYLKLLDAQGELREDLKASDSDLKKVKEIINESKFECIV